MLELWNRLVAFGFRLLYNELAWTYDAVSWLASRGKWRSWQRSMLPYLPPAGRILEVGSGPGHTVVDLVSSGYAVVGVDKSAAMLRQARSRTRRDGLEALLVRGTARSLPLAPGSFDAVLAAFPTSYAYERAWVDEVVRVLRDGGRLVVAELAYLSSSTADRVLERLYEVTGQRGPAPDLVDLLCRAGLRAWNEVATVDDTSVVLVIAEKPAVKS